MAGIQSYVGDYIFNYPRANQGNVIKAYLKDIATDSLKRAAKQHPWESFTTIQKREAIDFAEHTMRHFSPEVISLFLSPDYPKPGQDKEQSRLTSVGLYHVLNLIAKLITYPADFDIKHDLACRIIKESFGSVDFEESI